MCTEVLTITFIIMEFENIDTKFSITLSKIMKTIVCPTQMINIACQNVTEGTDSFDFCEVRFHNQSSKLQTEEHYQPLEKQQLASQKGIPVQLICFL